MNRWRDLFCVSVVVCAIIAMNAVAIAAELLESLPKVTESFEVGTLHVDQLDRGIGSWCWCLG
jgi:hypothetical protein